MLGILGSHCVLALRSMSLSIRLWLAESTWLLNVKWLSQKSYINVLKKKAANRSEHTVGDSNKMERVPFLPRFANFRRDLQRFSICSSISHVCLRIVGILSNSKTWLESIQHFGSRWPLEVFTLVKYQGVSSSDDLPQAPLAVYESIRHIVYLLCTFNGYKTMLHQEGDKNKTRGKQNQNDLTTYIAPIVLEYVRQVIMSNNITDMHWRLLDCQQ